MKKKYKKFYLKFILPKYSYTKFNALPIVQHNSVFVDNHVTNNTAIVINIDKTFIFFANRINIILINRNIHYICF